MDASLACQREPGSHDAFTRFLGVLTIMGCLCSTVGCGTLSNGRGWGQDAFSKVDRKTIARAARDAFFDVQTLLPAAAAAVLGPSGLGESLSDWAAEQTPMFGSQETARNVSDYLVGLLGAETMATLMATPSGFEAGEWWQAKAKGLGVEILAAGVTAVTTIGLKAGVDRERPNDEDQFSFPSGHASNAFSLSTLSNRNLDSLELAPWLRTSLQVSNIVTASTIAWARVEAHEHFPEDVLVGAALGHFLSAFIHDALIGLPASRRCRLLIWPSKSEAMVSVAFSF
jgi:membrane-associated phospholipid phosphatase